MKRAVHYRQGYRIEIRNRFYEVSDGKIMMHFGEMRHIPTLQEVWNRTIGLNKEADCSNGKRIKACH